MPSEIEINWDFPTVLDKAQYYVTFPLGGGSTKMPDLFKHWEQVFIKNYMVSKTQAPPFDWNWSDWRRSFNHQEKAGPCGHVLLCAFHTKQQSVALKGRYGATRLMLTCTTLMFKVIRGFALIWFNQFSCLYLKNKNPLDGNKGQK